MIALSKEEYEKDPCGYIKAICTQKGLTAREHTLIQCFILSLHWYE